MKFLHRRQFLASSLTAAAVAPQIAQSASQAAGSFSFVLLGDLHYDKLDHHDFDWLEKNHAGDRTQIINYSRITSELTPQLFDAVRKSVADSQAAFVIQVGDLVQGLCGSQKLSIIQNQEAVDFIDQKKLGTPFLFTKGNHDVTGDGATEAFKEVFYPYLNRQTAAISGVGRVSERASYAIEYNDTLFCFYDAYDKGSLDWFEAVISQRKARHCFVIIHPPVVPYGARATWYLYSSEKDQTKRAKLLELLGKNEAFVLGGHIHRFNTICRETSKGSRFAQLAISSVVNRAVTQIDTELDGLKEYNGDQIRVEPKHAPGTEALRRQVYESEAPFVRSFAYADSPGHAVITIEGNNVRATIYSGITHNVYRNIDLTKLLAS